MKFIKFFILILIIIFSSCLLFAFNKSEQGKFHINFKKDQKIDFEANKAKVSDILKTISEETNIAIRTVDQDVPETVTAVYKDISLEEFIKRLLRKNYAMVFNGNVLQNASQAESSLNQKSPVYQFPKIPSRVEWEYDIQKLHEIHSLIQLPEEILHSISTEDLIEICSNYPAWPTGTNLYHSLDGEMQEIAKYFNGLQELLSRRDTKEKLLQKYFEINPEKQLREIMDDRQNWSQEREEGFVNSITFIEILLIQDEVFSQFSSDERLQLMQSALDNVREKEKYSEIYSSDGVSATTQIIREIMQEENFVNYSDESGEIKPNVTMDQVDQIVSDAERFLENSNFKN